MTSEIGGTGIDADTTLDATDPPASGDLTKRQLRGSSLLFSGRLISLGVNFVTQVLIARYLSEADFGAFALALSLAATGATIVTFGLDRGISRFLAIYDERGDQERMLGTLAMVAGTVLALGFALIALVIGLQGVLLGTVVNDRQALTLLLILIPLAPIDAADNLLGGALAVFANARSIFVRKYVVGPLLRLLTVVLLVAGQYGVGFLAFGYVLSGAIGVLLYASVLWRVMGQRGLTRIRAIRLRVPARDVLSFTIPLLSTDLLFIAMNTTDALFLGLFHGTEEVAALRVIQPLVGLNLLVFSSFTILYTPVASRLFARNDRSGVADLYWRTAIWMAVFSFPIFAVTTSLAEPITVTLYGERYADSALYLALLSFGAYTNAALGFNGLTLRVFGFVRYTIVINLIAAAVNVTLNLLLIPQYGALGAAISTMSTTILHNILKQLGLRLGTGIDVFAWNYLRVYVLIALATVGLGAIQWLFQPNIIVGLALAGIASLIVVLANRSTVRLEETIPEVLRLPFMRQLLGVRR